VSSTRRPLARAALVAALATGLVAAGPLPLLAAPGRPTTPSYHAGPLRPAGPRVDGCSVQGTTQELQVSDRGAPGGSRRVWLYRPGVPDSGNVPVVYVLHGLPGDAGDFPSTGLGALLDQRICDGARPVVVVSPDGNAADGSDTEWADAADGRFRVESFVTDGLIRVVEGANKRPPSRRALVGFSMGGYGAAALALRHRGLYGQVAALSGYFSIDDPDDTFGSHAIAHDPAHLLGQARGLRILLEEARNDGDPVAAGQTARFAALLRGHHLPATVHTTAGSHSFAWVRSVLPEVLQYLDAGWR